MHSSRPAISTRPARSHRPSPPALPREISAPLASAAALRRIVRSDRGLAANARAERQGCARRPTSVGTPWVIRASLLAHRGRPGSRRCRLDPSDLPCLLSGLDAAACWAKRRRIVGEQGTPAMVELVQDQAAASLAARQLVESDPSRSLPSNYLERDVNRQRGRSPVTRRLCSTAHTPCPLKPTSCWKRAHAKNTVVTASPRVS